MHEDGTPEDAVEKCEDCGNLIVHPSEHSRYCKYSRGGVSGTIRGP